MSKRKAHMVSMIDLYRDGDDPSRVWLKLHSEGGDQYHACIDAAGVDALHDMLGQFIAGRDCQCPDCVAERAAMARRVS